MSTEKKIAKLENVELGYFDIGEGEPILLLHGFASTAAVNWLNTGWIKTLNEEGYRCIALDHRGHGDSTKFYDADNYGPDYFTNDALALLDRLEIDKCHVLGFSMGARVTAWMCYAHPQRVISAVFGGMGARMTNTASDYTAVAEALEADDPTTLPPSPALGFRTFADRVGADRLALAACIRPSRQKITEEHVRAITTQVLVAVGDEDEIGGSATQLASIMQNAEGFDMPGLDHMRSTGAKVFKEKVVEFLKRGRLV